MEIKNFLPIILICSVCSCNLYYKTSDVDNNFRLSVENINSNCDKLTTQIKSYQREFLELNCANSTTELKLANRMFDEINKEISEMNRIKSLTIKSYYDFAISIKGKTEIHSGSNEWHNFKSTKKQLNNSAKLIQKLGEKAFSNAEKLDIYISKNVVPKIQKCITKDYEMGLAKEIDSLTKFQKEFSEKLNQYSSQVERIAIKYRTTQAEKCQMLLNDLKSLIEFDKDLKAISLNSHEIKSSFILGIKGNAVIYSCSSDWAIVQKTEERIKKQEQLITELNVNVQKIQSQIQNTLNSFK
jgi:hypothetical protein